MPRALRICTTKDCPEPSKQGKCDKCRRTESKSRAPERMDYGAAWRTTSHAFLARHPHCFACGSKAHHVDHIDGQGIHGPRAYDWSNLQSLCISCHSKKTVAFDGGFGRWSQDGKPLDN